MDEEYLQEFYTENDPGRRLSLLDQISQDEKSNDGAMSPDTALRKSLLELRYGKGGRKRDYSDQFLLQCINLISISRAKVLFPSQLQGEVNRAMKGIGMDLLGKSIAKGDLSREDAASIFYQEYHHTGALYFSTYCASDHRKFFGLLSRSKEEQVSEMKRQASEMSTEISKRWHVNDDLFPIWSTAIQDALNRALAV
ncbi:MAG: hypothetical protein LKE85_00175 [Lachnospiraceae bacterium]|jgi:hypothetical protein|nr:hypothetical protein [Lachnospiraceae bacterium]